MWPSSIGAVRARSGHCKRVVSRSGSAARSAAVCTLAAAFTLMLAAAFALTLAACASASTDFKAEHRSATGGTSGRARSNEQAAKREAVSLLGDLSLPNGATQARRDPSESNALASTARLSSPELVDRHRFFVLPQAPPEVVAWVRSHQPPGARLEGHWSGVPALAGWTFALTPQGGRLSAIRLVVELAAAKGGGTALRVDGEVTWVRPRPRSERIPRGVKVVSVVLTDRSRHISLHRTLADRRSVRRAISIVEGLPLYQGGIRRCPPDRHRNTIVHMRFRKRRASKPVATVTIDDNSCTSVRLRVHGHAEPALSGADEATQELRALLRHGPAR